MKRLIMSICATVICIATLFSTTAFAAGDPNIGGGGGGMGGGSTGNYWNETYDGVRLTLVRADTGQVVSQSVDVSNRDTSIVQVYFGKNSKRAYNNGLSLSPRFGGYISYVPSIALPKIINSAAYPSDINAIRRYFCDENVLRWFANKISMDYDVMLCGDYKLMVEPVAYIVYGRVWTALTATEAALYNQQLGGNLRAWFGALTNKNLPLAIYLEHDELGYSAWTGERDVFVEDPMIISTLGVGIVRFTGDYGGYEEPPEAPDYIYRTDTDVITSVYVSGGGQADPDRPVTVTFNIAGTNYTVSNVYYPADRSQLVWVQWHTPRTPQTINITVSTNAGRTLSTTSIRCNVVDLTENPPPNPTADDRNDSYNRSLATVPANPEITSTSWAVWRARWHPNYVWHADWQWESNVVWVPNLVWVQWSHNPYCPRNCTVNHGYYRDDGWYENRGRWVDHGRYGDEGWWEFFQDTYSASFSGSASLTPDTLDPTAYGDTIKSGYGVNILVNGRVNSTDTAAVTGAQNAMSYFPEFYYGTYWRVLEKTGGGLYSEFQFKTNPYSTYGNRTHFTPVWMKDGSYVVYTWLFDAWTPNGMLSMNMTDGVTISGTLWDDWHIAPENPD